MAIRRPFRRRGKKRLARKARRLRTHPRLRAFLRRMKDLPTLEELERLLVVEAMRRCRTKTAAAAAVGITREGFRKKLVRMRLA